ncbi:hypothetical protein [Laceyella putida]|uniref:Uncharacterized protein n=1 Tax=Laceyella putida TaxID=110101 RepID=A0ABW2RF80_9BACL
MSQLENVIYAVKALPQTEEKQALIESMINIFAIPVHQCDKCQTDSIIFYEDEGQVYCLFCDSPIPQDDYVECDCGGQGILEDVTDSDGITDERAVCLKCEKVIPKDSCWYDGVTGYNFPHALVDVDEDGNNKYEPVCVRCYRTLHDPEYI